MKVRRHDRSGRFIVRTLAVAGLMAAIGALYVCERVAMVSVGYRIDAGLREVTRLGNEHRHLNVKLAELGSPTRGPDLSRGFTAPESWQVVRVSAGAAAYDLPAELMVAKPTESRLSRFAGDFRRGLARIVGRDRPADAEPVVADGPPLDKS